MRFFFIPERKKTQSLSPACRAVVHSATVRLVDSPAESDPCRFPMERRLLREIKATARVMETPANDAPTGEGLWQNPLALLTFPPRRGNRRDAAALQRLKCPHISSLLDSFALPDQISRTAESAKQRTESRPPPVSVNGETWQKRPKGVVDCSDCL